MRSSYQIGPERLTAREVEVLHLITQGKQNREIADTLVISVHTVERHVSNILGKLGVDSRTQAAVLAVGKGMVTADMGDFQDV